MLQRMADLLLMVCICILATTAVADITSDFQTDPFSSTSPTWCARYHHVHWYTGFGAGFMKGWHSPGNMAECTAGYGGTFLSCTTPSTNPLRNCTTCQVAPASPPCSTVGPEVGFVLTYADHVGAVRTSAVDFSIPSAGMTAPGAHLPIFSAAHPNCHVGVQGYIVPASGNLYRLGINIGGDPLANFPECTANGGLLETTGTVTLLPGTQGGLLTPYRLKLNSAKSGTILSAHLEVWSNITNTKLPLELDFSITPVPGWYDDEARRFGFGASSRTDDDPMNGVVYDNFSGTASSLGC